MLGLLLVILSAPEGMIFVRGGVASCDASRGTFTAAAPARGRTVNG